MSTTDNPGGIAASHPELELFDILVAPSTGKEKNTIRMELQPTACWKINDTRFDFGSSFVLPESKSEFKELQRLREGHAGAPFSVFGHADPTGDDAFNKRLSDHRSESIYAVLTHDVARWEKLYNFYGQGEGWGTASIQHMLTALGEAPGPVTGTMNPETQAAVKSFQGKNELKDDGDPGPKTRAKLFAAYQIFLWPKKMEKTEFLGGGVDAGGKADFQGCSEFNPVVVFSSAERAELDKPANREQRNSENGPNRRVMVLLFRPGIVVPPDKWPCPRTGEGGAGCHKRFWSDGEQRRKNQAARREFVDVHNTFACRFYHRLVEASPCEGIDPALLVIRLIKVDDHFAPSTENLDIEYDLYGVSGRAIKLQIEADNYEPKVIFERELTAAEKADDGHTTTWDGKITGGPRAGRFATPLMGPFRVRLSSPGIADATMGFKILYHSVELAFGKHTPDEVTPAEAETTKFAQAKLNDLGYDAGPVNGTLGDVTVRALRRFQRANYKVGTQVLLAVNGTADADTVAALKVATRRELFEAGKNPLTDDAKFYVYDNFMNDPDMDFVVGPMTEFNSFDRKTFAEDKMERPFLALEAVVKLLNKANAGVVATDAVGEAPVGWETSDAPEDATVVPAANPLSQTYVKNAREIGATAVVAGAARIDADGDNALDTFDGFRKAALTDTVEMQFPKDDGSKLEPYKIDRFDKQVRGGKPFPQAMVKAWDDPALFPQRKGRAGVYFRFSNKGGDDAKVRAALNFEGLPNQATLDADHTAAGVTLFAETGRWTVWRRTRFSAYCAMGVPTATERPSGVPNWATIRDLFKQAFIEVENNGTPLQILNYAAIITDPVYRATVMAMPSSHRPPGVTSANLRYSPTAIYGGPVPVQAPGTTALQHYQNIQGTSTTVGIVEGWSRHVINAILRVIYDAARKTSPEGYVIFDYRLADMMSARDWDPTMNGGAGGFRPAANPFFHAFRVGGRGYVRCAGAVTLNLDNNAEVNDYTAHEGGHARFLYHHTFVDETVPPHSANSANPNHHDAANLKCTMSYTKAPDNMQTLIKQYCGKCLLRLRGWNVLALPNRYT
jgi:peptidoglycan hydrolase-like protein with peptidoglycan-binding domain